MSLLLARRLAQAYARLDPVTDRVQCAARGARGAAPPVVRNALDGTWLGVPLHPPLTDVPIGAWTAAVLLDAAEGATGSDSLRRSADGALAVGVAAAVPAALTGMNDWSELRGESKRIGSLHALMNVAGLGLNVASLALRGTGRRGLGQAASALGYLASATAAHLGGQLSFGLGIRVNRTAWQRGPGDFTPALAEAELGAEELRGVEVDGVPVLITRSRAGELCAIAATCSHLGGPLPDGKREGDTVACPWHGSRFDVCTGEVVEGPAVFPQPRFEVRTAEGRIEVRAAR